MTVLSLNDASDSAAPAVDRWTDRVRRPRPGQPRNLLREAAVSLGAQRRVARNTSDMQAVFELLENFPVGDVLRHSARRSRFANSAPLQTLFREQSLPDLSDAAVERLSELPEGSVGHEYARFVRGWGLDNQFLDHIDRTKLEGYLAYRTAHLHDLFHFVLGYSPYAYSGEMEIEAFLYGQTGGWNHLLFMAGFARRLAAIDRAQLRTIAPRLRAAQRRGENSGNVMLLRWEDHLARPLEAVRAELGIDDLPALERQRPRPTETPRLAHVVLNADKPDATVAWYTKVFGLETTAADDRLGATFMSDGTDHHTLAVARSWGRGIRGKLRGVSSDLATLRHLLDARRHGPRSSTGAPIATPPLALVREHMRPGINHIGYRVSSMEELRRWYGHLSCCGVGVDWMVNHGDLISGIYFLDPAGVRIEIFADGPKGTAKLAAKAAGASREELAEPEFFNWKLDLHNSRG